MATGSTVESAAPQPDSDSRQAQSLLVNMLYITHREVPQLYSKTYELRSSNALTVSHTWSGIRLDLCLVDMIDKPSPLLIQLHITAFSSIV